MTREIVIPISLEDYREVVGDNDRFRRLLAQFHELHPECFPPTFDANFSFKDFKYSKKMDVRIRRIRVGLGTDAHFWRVVPCDVMPYMVGRTDEVEKALFLRKFNVPYWGLEHVFGRSSNYFWRIECRMGRTSIAGSVAGRAGSGSDGANTLPEDICCDEKHGKYIGKKAYIAVSAGGGCVLGAELTEGADKDSLAAGYGVLQDEIEAAAPGHEIRSVNTDGFTSTIAAVRAVWGDALLITCILHLFIAMRDGCKRKYREQFELVADAFWWCYEAETKRSFAQRWRAFVDRCEASRDWLPERIIEKVKSADARKLASYKAWYDRPDAHRVSVAVDCVMGSLDRRLFAMRHLRGHFVNSRLLIRAWWRITYGGVFFEGDGYYRYPVLFENRELTLHLDEVTEEIGIQLGRQIREPDWLWPRFSHDSSYPRYAWSEKAWSTYQAESQIRKNWRKWCEERRAGR